jgi:hypothetical protein|eukprot:3684688-Prymnesium_polylepis.1
MRVGAVAKGGCDRVHIEHQNLPAALRGTRAPYCCPNATGSLDVYQPCVYSDLGEVCEQGCLGEITLDVEAQCRIVRCLLVLQQRNFP